LQPLAILFGAAFTAATAYSLGAVLLRSACADPAVRFVSGGAVLSVLIFAACALNLVYPATFLLIGAASILAARHEWRIPARPKLTRWSFLFLPYFVLYFFNAMAPEISYDGSRYHLALVGRYFREHGFHSAPDTLYAALSQGVEMLYLFAYTFGRHSAAAMVHFVFLAALAWQLYAWALRRGWTLAGRCAAFLVFASPIVGVDGTSAYVDVAVAAIAFTLFYVLDLWSPTRDSRLLVAAGLLAGFAFAAKYTAFLAVPYALAVVLWKTRSPRVIAALASFVAIEALPWLLKDYLQFGNPLAPFFNHWFPNPHFTSAFESSYRAGLASLGPYRPADLPLQVTMFGSMSGPLGPVFLLSPLALLALRSAVARRLLLPAAVFGAAWFANVNTRFLIPAIPFLALALSFVLAVVPRAAVAVVLVHALLSWPSILRLYCRPDAWHLVKVPYREALRIKPEPGFLESNLPYYGITRRIDELTPPGAVILTEVPIPDAYTSRQIRVGYQSQPNIVSRRVWFTGFVPEHAPVLRARFAFAPRALRSFRLVQLGQGTAPWTVHEVRAFDGPRELSRVEWRAAARPFPWGLDAVLDGRIASFWMCVDNLRPGQYLQFDLPAGERIDAVEIRTALDQPDARFALEIADDAGRWSRHPGEPQYDQVPPPPDLRRLAAEELKRRGIGYLLAFDGQFGAADLRDRAAEWGIREITEYKGARLYQLP
jgi:hypothetical protein